MQKWVFLFLLISIPLFAQRGRARNEEVVDSAEKLALQQSIAEYRVKIADIDMQIERAERGISEEATQLSQWRKEWREEQERFRQEESELLERIASVEKSSDSLSRDIGRVSMQTREIENRIERFRADLLEAIDGYRAVLEGLPSPIIAQELQGLIFLRSEIVSGSASLHEGVERLWHLAKAVSRDRTTVDSWVGPSTFDDIPGQVSYIRFGYAWLALANEAGTAAALWVDNEWRALTDPEQIAAVARAVRIRSGNALPEIVRLPVFLSLGGDK